MNLVILDDGHSSQTAGKTSPSGIKENDFNYRVVETLRTMLLQRDDIDVFLTAGERNWDVPLKDRVERANDTYKKFRTSYLGSKTILISVHYNANTGNYGNANGIEVYYNTSVDFPLAQAVHDSIIMGTKQTDRGIKQAQFYILTGNMPSCLVEFGFMDNKEEEKLMKSESFIMECATELYVAILNYFKISEKKKPEITFKQTLGGCTYMCAGPEDLKVRIVDKSNTNLGFYDNYVNGTFFWFEQAYKTYPTSILYANGNIYHNDANHIELGCPQSVLIIYNNGQVGMKRIKSLKELDLTKVRLAIGGLGLVNKADKSFKYSPAVEGFYGQYADVLRFANKTVIGYHRGENKIYLLTKKCLHDTLQKLCANEDETKGFNFEYAISVDGGGSTTFKYNGKEYVKGDGRIINNIITFS